MNVTIFNQITTEESLLAIEEEAKTFDGLHLEMNDDSQRKFAKDSSKHIKSILKRLDRARIDLVSDYKSSVEEEAASISLRLEAANSPFTNLIDEWQAERDQINKEKKAREDAKNLAIEKERDHEFALLMDDRVMADKREAEAAKVIYEDNLKKEAAAKAVLEASEKIAKAKRFEAAEDARRLANTEHVRSVNNEAFDSLMEIRGIVDGDLAKAIITAIARNQIKNISIKY